MDRGSGRGACQCGHHAHYSCPRISFAWFPDTPRNHYAGWQPCRHRCIQPWRCCPALRHQDQFHHPPLIVKVNISSFEEQEVPYPAKVPIARIDALSSFGSSTLDVGPEGAHDLLALTPTVGRVFYTYRLAVFVGQNTVLDAPVGKYVAPLVLHIGAVSQSNMLHDKE